jgi:ankyrin repeat protein
VLKLLVEGNKFSSLINHRGEKGLTALQMACSRGGGFYYDAALVLLKAKADPNIRDAYDASLIVRRARARE